MIKSFYILILGLFIFGCSNKATKNVSFSIVAGNSTVGYGSAVMKGGIMIWGTNGVSQVSLFLTHEGDNVFDNGETSIDLDPSGVWSFSAVGWDGIVSGTAVNTPMSGNVRCGRGQYKVDPTIGNQTVALVLSEASCADPVFNPVGYTQSGTSPQFYYLATTACNRFPSSTMTATTQCNYPLDENAGFASYRIHLPQNIPGLGVYPGPVSDCLNMLSGTSTATFNLRLPFSNNTNGENFPVIIQSYFKKNCDGPVYSVFNDFDWGRSFNFSAGLVNSPENALSESLSASSTASSYNHLYISHAPFGTNKSPFFINNSTATTPFELLPDFFCRVSGTNARENCIPDYPMSYAYTTSSYDIAVNNTSLTSWSLSTALGPYTSNGILPGVPTSTSSMGTATAVGSGFSVTAMPSCTATGGGYYCTLSVSVPSTSYYTGAYAPFSLSYTMDGVQQQASVFVQNDTFLNSVQLRNAYFNMNGSTSGTIRWTGTGTDSSGDHMQMGDIGDVRDLLGSQAFGGLLSSKGFSDCSQITDISGTLVTGQTYQVVTYSAASPFSINPVEFSQTPTFNKVIKLWDTGSGDNMIYAFNCDIRAGLLISKESNSKHDGIRMFYFNQATDPLSTTPRYALSYRSENNLSDNTQHSTYSILQMAGSLYTSSASVVVNTIGSYTITGTTQYYKTQVYKTTSSTYSYIPVSISSATAAETYTPTTEGYNVTTFSSSTFSGTTAATGPDSLQYITVIGSATTPSTTICNTNNRYCIQESSVKRFDSTCTGAGTAYSGMECEMIRLYNYFMAK